MLGTIVAVLATVGYLAVRSSDPGDPGDATGARGARLRPADELAFHGLGEAGGQPLAEGVHQQRGRAREPVARLGRVGAEPEAGLLAPGMEQGRSPRRALSRRQARSRNLELRPVLVHRHRRARGVRVPEARLGMVGDDCGRRAPEAARRPLARGLLDAEAVPRAARSRREPAEEGAEETPGPAEAEAESDARPWRRSRIGRRKRATGGWHCRSRSCR